MKVGKWVGWVKKKGGGEVIGGEGKVLVIKKKDGGLKGGQG